MDTVHIIISRALAPLVIDITEDDFPGIYQNMILERGIIHPHCAPTLFNNK